MAQHIIITGISGPVGQALATSLLRQGHRVTGVSRGEAQLVHSGYTHMIVPDFAYAAPPPKADVLIHLAWAGSTGQDRNNLELQLSNVLLARQVVDFAAEAKVKRFVGVGTITEAELEHSNPSLTPGPGFIYGLAKNAAREATFARAQELGLTHVWLRLGNVYWPQDNSGRFLPSSLAKLQRGEAVELKSPNQIYDFLHLEDAVQGLTVGALRGHHGYSYYVGSGSPRPLKEYFEEAKEKLNSGAEVVYDDHRFSEGLSLGDFSIELLQAHCSYSPHHSFTTDLKELTHGHLLHE